MSPRRLIFGFILLAVSPLSGQTSTTRPYAPVVYTREIQQDPPLRIHTVAIDLADPSVHVLTPRGASGDPHGRWQTELRPVSVIAREEHLAVAVNGDFFHPMLRLPIGKGGLPYFGGNPANVCGWAMSDGLLWSTHPAPVSLVVDDQGAVSIGRFAAPPLHARQIVSTLFHVVSHGRNTGAASTRAPRTAVGIDATGKKMVLLVADGRRPTYSVGLTLAELGQRMIGLGCEDAMCLDCGGSSTLVIRDPATAKYEVANTPSDGHDLAYPLSVERPVANVLGIRIDGLRDPP